MAFLCFIPLMMLSVSIPSFAAESLPSFSKKLLIVPEAKVATGKSLSLSSEGHLAAVWSAPFNLIIWDQNLNTIQRTDRTEGLIESPADIDFWGQLSLFLCDDWNGAIIQYNRRLKIVNKILNTVETGFEPNSLCLDSRGRIFTVNRADGKVWTVDARLTGTHRNIAQPLSSPLINPQKIRYDSSNDQLVILEEHSVAICKTNGRVIKRIVSEVPDPRAIACDSNAIWVVGDRLERLPLSVGGKRLLFPDDSLKTWGVYPVAAVATDGKSKVYLLSETGGRLLELIFSPDAFRAE